MQPPRDASHLRVGQRKRQRSRFRPEREFLVWVAFRQRTEADAIEAWGSHCPRVTVWEDAQEAGLVAVVGGRGARGDALIALTAAGRAALASGAP